MKTYAPDKIRNVGLAAHSGAGKTSLAEAMLYDSKAINRLGSVIDGTTVMDHDPEEIKRAISISSSIASCEWNNHKINIIDTPGDQNFVPDALSSIRVMDSVIIIVPAEDGVRAQTEKVWNWAEEAGIARVLFINKMDSERASYDNSFKEIQDVFKHKTLKFTLPIGQGSDFRGVVDLLYMKAYIYAKEGEGRFTTEDVPEDMREVAKKERQEMIESVAETDEELLDKFMEAGELEDQDLHAGLRRAICAGEVVPVLCGSAALNIVVRKTLDLIVNFLPSPLEVAPRPARDDKGKSVEVKPDPNGPGVALIFKTIADPFAGKLSLLRVFSGSFDSDSNAYNATKDEKEHLGSLLALHGKKQTPISKGVFGDIMAVAKLKSTVTGDTLCAGKTKLVFDGVEMPQPVISFAIAPKSKGDEEKISSGLARQMEEDPTLRVVLDKQTKERIVSGMGQVHIEVVISKLKEKFGVEVDIKPPQIAYQETIRGKSKGHGRHKKQSGGHGQFADCHIELEPTADSKEFEFVNAIVGGAIPRQYIPGVEKGVLEAMGDGVLAGYPVTSCKVKLVDGKFHDVDSSELAFKIAGRMAFREAFMAAKPVLLEPMVEIEIEAPEECVGDVMGDLNQRRGRVQGVDTAGGGQKIKAIAPMAETMTYAPDLRSITGGRGQFTMHFHSYEEVPAQLSAKIVEAAKKSKEDSK